VCTIMNNVNPIPTGWGQIMIAPFLQILDLPPGLMSKMNRKKSDQK